LEIYPQGFRGVLETAAGYRKPIYLTENGMDNFEWAAGYYPRFGFLSYNQRTLARHARPSTRVFRRIARSGTLPRRARANSSPCSRSTSGCPAPSAAARKGVRGPCFRGNRWAHHRHGRRAFVYIGIGTIVLILILVLLIAFVF
jgi:Glycosyl hydrolase family 1